MELRKYASMLRRWWWLLAVAAVLAAGLSYVISFRLPRVYSATTTLAVGQIIQNPNPQQQDFANSERLAQTYVQLVRRQPLLQAVSEMLGLAVPGQSLANQVSARTIPGTQLLQISVTSTDPTAARVIADEVARQLILQTPNAADTEHEQRRDFARQQLVTLQSRITEAEQEIKGLEERLAWESSARAVQDVQGQIAAARQKIASWQSTYASLVSVARGAGTNSLVVVEPAVASPVPISPNVPRNVLLAASIGLLLAAAGILLIEYLDDTLKTTDDVARALGVPCLAAIAHVNRSQRPADQLAAVHGRPSSLAEAHRMLRTNIQLSSLTSFRGPGMTLLITSAVLGEGKTTTACNLAIALAQGGKRVILCDADLRRPSVLRLFDLPGLVGLTTLLADDSMSAEAALVDTGVPRLRILPSGPVPPNPSDLLGSDAFTRRIDQLKELADVIILDSPAVLAAADATILGALCHGVVLVVEAGRTQAGAVRASKVALEQVGARVFGAALNKVTRYRPAYYSTVDEARVPIEVAAAGATR